MRRITIKVHDNQKLSDICEIYLGGTPKTSVEEYWNGSIDWASAKDISNCNSRYIMQTEKTITQEGLKKSPAKLLPRGTIVITARGTVGKLAILPREMTFNQTCYGLIPKNGIESLYLYYAIQNSLKQIAKLTYGTIFDTITKKTFTEITIPLPETKQRKLIVEVLGTIDDKIELNQQMNEKLEQLAQALFRSWFIEFEPFQDGEFEDTELGRIPKGWKYTNIGNSTENFDSKRVPVSRRKREEMQGIYPYYGATSIMDYVNDYLFDGIYLLVAEDGSVIDELHKPILQYVHGKIWVNNHAHVLQGKIPFSTEFIWLSLNHTNVNPYITGAVQLKINQGNLNRIPIIEPPIDVLERFNNLIQPLFDKIRINEDESLKLLKLRDLLLPQLISGRIQIKEPEKFLEMIHGDAQ